jgi:hypothetical protein
MRVGTSYFVCFAAACRYYAQTHKGDIARIVEHKLEVGDIHIGHPPLKHGQKLVKIDDKTRWAIEEY